MHNKVAPRPLTELCKDWAPPKKNWLDYFVDPRALTRLTNNAKENIELICELTMQFLEQSLSSDKDIGLMIDRKMEKGVYRKYFFHPGIPHMESHLDDIVFSQRKAACLWLCTMSCFAASEWNFEAMVDEKKHNIHLVRTLIDRTVAWMHDREFANFPWAAEFTEFLNARWVLYVNRMYRTPPPAGKPTVNNPGLIEDQAIIRANFSRKASVEIRAQASEAAACLERILVECRKIYSPSVTCFLAPFVEGCDAYLSIGILGNDVLIEGIPIPELGRGNIEMEQIDLQNMCRFELAGYNLGKMHFPVTKKYIQDLSASFIVKDTSFHLVNVDIDALNGYCAAFKLPHLGNGTPIAPVTYMLDEKTVSDDISSDRRFAVRRLLSEREARGAMVVITKAENTARSCIDSIPESLRAQLAEQIPQGLERFAQALKRLEVFVRDDNSKRRIRAMIYYLCAMVPKLDNAFGPEMRGVITPPLSSPTALPPILNGLCASDDPFWNLLVNFDAVLIKQFLTACGDSFVLPTRYKFPELLADVVLVTRPINVYHAILLGKVQQLCDIKNLSLWTQHSEQYFGVFGELAKRNEHRILYEVIRVQTITLNDQLRNAHCTIDAGTIQKHANLIKEIYRSSQGVIQVPNPNEFYVDTTSFLLNTGEYDFVMNGIENNLSIPALIVSKLIAAWNTVNDSPEKQGGFVVGFMQLVGQTGLFDSSSSNRRNEHINPRDMPKHRKHIIQLFKQLTDQSHLSLIISYMCYLYNRVLVTRNRESRLLLHCQFNGMMCAHEKEIPHLNSDFIEEALLASLRTGLSINPTNAFWLRSLGDYYYSKCQTDVAASLYMETLCACTENFTPPFPDNVVNDSMWYRLRVCLSSVGCHTLAGLVAQSMVGLQGNGNAISATGRLDIYKSDQYIQVFEKIRTQHVTDASEILAPLIFDHQLAEMLSEGYESTGQTHKTDTILHSTGLPAMNMCNSGEVYDREKKRRTIRMLRTVAAFVFEVHV